MSTSQNLDALRFPLWGSRLIEASAGTGKTWTIAALYLRLVLGHGGADAHPRPLRPGEILVMTFTRAATRELSDRIRARLIEAARCFRGELEPAAHDGLLRELMGAYPDGTERQAAAWRLAMAAEGMDEAAVHTIDAWCQRMLREHAFDSGNLFDETLVADEARLLTEAVQDYWRQQVYPLQGEGLDRVLTIWSGVDALAEDMKALLADPPQASVAALSLQQVMATEHQQWADTVNRLRAGWSERVRWLRGWFATQLSEHKKDWNGNKLRADSVDKWMTLLQDWADAPEPIAFDFKELATGARRLTPEGLLDARGSKAGPIDVPPVFSDAEQLLGELQRLPAPGSAARLHAAATVHARLRRLKRQTAQFGFADMVDRLDQALSGSHGERLRQRILTQYPVALIDEFQDTSPRQFRLFDQLYRTADNDPHTALLLIGDPKQSIYGFRGADIHAYLQARRATEGRHYMLGTNHRSTVELVGAVNHWFVQAESRPGPGAFLFREGEDNRVPFVPVAARGRPERFVSGAGAVPAVGVGDHRLAGLVDRAAVQADAGGWLDRHAHHHVLPAGDAAQHATGVVRQIARRRHFVRVLGTTLHHAVEAGADLDALDGVDAHHRVGDVGIEAVVHRLAPADRHARGHHVDARTDRVARLAQLIHEGIELGQHGHIGGEEGIALGVQVLPGIERDLDRPELRHVAADDDAVALAQPLAGNRTGGHTHRGFAGRGTTTTARIANAVLLPVAVVGVTGAEGLGDVGVILAALVLVADQQRNRRAGGHPLVHPRQDLDRIRFAALRDMARGARLAPVELGLDVRLADRQPRGATVDHAANGRTMRLAKGRHAKQLA